MQFDENHARLNTKLIFAIYDTRRENAEKVNNTDFNVEFNDFSKVFFLSLSQQAVSRRNNLLLRSRNHSPLKMRNDKTS